MLKIKLITFLQVLLQWGGAGGLLINNPFSFMSVFPMNYYCNFLSLGQRPGCNIQRVSLFTSEVLSGVRRWSAVST